MTDLRRRWTSAFVVGELVGFVPPALTGATLAAIGVGDAVLVLGLTAAGLLEGACLGLAQAWVLARHAPSVDRRDWVVATTVAAGFAWFVGMGGGALMGSEVAPPGVLALALVPAWTIALLGMGFAQWLVLRRSVTGSASWIRVTAGAWLVGVAIPVTVLSVVPDAWSAWTQVIAGVAAAVAMGVTVGALTGRRLERLLTQTLGEGRPGP